MRTLLPALALCVALAVPAAAQERSTDEPRSSPNAVAGQTVGTTDVEVTYGRPSARGRAVFGELVPYGEVWRTGANEAATFTASDDVMVEGERLPAGTYALFTVPGEDAWTIIFNRTPAQWGAFDYDEAEDALRVQVESAEAPMQEQFEVRFDDTTEDATTMLLHWDTVGVPVRIAAE
ncbi:DUF2911 domain-containing protein [Rubrivirga sp. S365]|uniref:DUF2911 domain-containing protein n=1 Tax=Rubrivirga litoralis TaxID=3075598 RepID=A0ABU3BTZ2_9BACT|nr:MULTISPECIES: DUF2911 domain-containing protein [unclassified Rubrivirga]MDT0632759.1 DUF2911 domain-containing protein [Rubrivirga sp. F394]MDT7855201.1 DUF2911 domain-containing protein [Rubrivirga sp. S365]